MTDSKFASEDEILEHIMLEEPGTLEEDPLVDDEGEIVCGAKRWFDGLPSWLSEAEAERDFGIGFWDPTVTIVNFWDAGPESFQMDGRTYTRKAHQASFGERECPLADSDMDDEFQPDGRCYYCEQTKEEGHGYLYVGEFALNIYSTPDSDND